MTDNNQKKLGNPDMLPVKVGKGSHLPAVQKNLPKLYQEQKSLIGSPPPSKPKDDPWWKNALRASTVLGVLVGVVWGASQYEPKASHSPGNIPQSPYTSINITYNENKDETLAGTLQLMNDVDTLSYLVWDYDKTEAKRLEGIFQEGVLHARPSIGGIAAPTNTKGGGVLGPNITLSEATEAGSFSKQPTRYVLQGIYNSIFEDEPSTILQSETVLQKKQVLPVSREVAALMMENGGQMYLTPVENSVGNDVTDNLNTGKKTGVPTKYQ